MAGTNILLRQKYHQYKMFTPAGVYLGLLQNVTTPFQYNQNIATAFAQLQITVGQSADVADQATTPLTDEAGNTITDESGNALLIERQPDIVGSSNSNALIANDNLIQVWEYSNYYPNGIIKFSGYVSKWKTTFGSTDDIMITCISDGQDLSQYLVTTGDAASISQLTFDGSAYALDPGNGKGGLDYQGVLQTFTVPSAIALGGVSVSVSTAEPGTLSINVSQQVGTQPAPGFDPTVTTGSIHLGTIAQSAQKVSFAVPTTISPGFTYYFWVSWSPDSGSTTFAFIYLSSLNPYANGSVWLVDFTGTVFVTGGNFPTQDCYFVIWAHGASVTGQYTNDDVSFMLTDIMNSYISNGGGVQIPTATGASVNSPYSDSSLPTAYWGNAYAQVFTPSVNLSLSVLELNAYVTSGNATFSVQICQGDPSLDTDSVIGGGFSYVFGGSNKVIGTSNPITISNATPSNIDLTFSAPIALVAGTKYYMLITFGQGAMPPLIIRGASTGETPTDTQVGRLYYNIFTFNNSGGAPSLDSSHPYLYMVLNPGSASGYKNTGNITSYTFKMQTILQAITSIISLAPSNWYWYVDPATNILQFAQQSATANITLVRKRHIDEIDIEATKESVINTVYFTGGDDGTATNTNILVKVSGTKGTSRVGLALLSDNRVNSTSGSVTTARLIAQNYINQNSAQTYITNVTITDQTMDINLFKLGQTVGFSGFGNFVDQLLLQVVGLNYASDQVTLQLGTLPARTSKAFANAEGQLAYLQTVDNPTTPS